MKTDMTTNYIASLSEETRNLIPEAEIKKVFEEGFENTNSSSPPKFFGIGGGVAAGKNTLLKKLQTDNLLPRNVYIHDPDAVMLSLDSYQEALKERGAIEAQKLFDQPALEIAESMLRYVTCSP